MNFFENKVSEIPETGALPFFGYNFLYKTQKIMKKLGKETRHNEEFIDTFFNKTNFGQVRYAVFFLTGLFLAEMEVRVFQ